MNDNTSTTSTLILLPQEVVQTTIEVVADGVFYEKTIDNITLEDTYTRLLWEEKEKILVLPSQKVASQIGNLVMEEISTLQLMLLKQIPLLILPIGITQVRHKI